MMNEKTQETLKSDFGRLMLRRVMVVNLLKQYDKELKAIDKEINDLVDEYTMTKEEKEKKDGCTVQQA